MTKTVKTTVAPVLTLSEQALKLPATEKARLAFDILADLFMDPITKPDADTGELKVVGNRMNFHQERILNGVPYQAFTSLKKLEQDLDKAREEANDLVRNHRGDEISESSLNRKLDWIERLQMQEAALAMVLESSTEAYKRHTGKDFRPPVMTPRVAGQFQSFALERAKRVTGLSGEAQQTDGVIRPARNAA